MTIQGRIRRTATQSDLWPEEPRRAPKVLLVDAGSPSLEVRYWRSRWSPFEVGGAAKRRDTVAAVVLEGQPIGRFQLCDFRADTFTSSAEFLEALDSGSAATFAVGETICAHWEYVEDITGYGDILELHRAWIEPSHSKPGRLAGAIRATIAALHPAHALMILQAFPLEYEGKVTEANGRAFERRRAALMRYYATSLGMAPLPDDAGEGGWMYAIPERLRGIECLTPSPRSAVRIIDRI